MRKREKFSVISVSSIDYLVNTVTRLKNAREFGLHCTWFEMLPSQDLRSRCPGIFGIHKLVR